MCVCVHVCVCVCARTCLPLCCCAGMTEVSWEPWGQVPGLGCVHLWRLQSSQLKVELLTLGATIRSVWSSGSNGQSADVVLGFDNLEGELEEPLRIHRCSLRRVLSPRLTDQPDV